MKPEKSEDLSHRLWRFAARVGKVVDALPDTRLGRHVASQLVRTGSADRLTRSEKEMKTTRDRVLLRFDKLDFPGMIRSDQLGLLFRLMENY
jgi:hypothetical protein